MRPLPSASRQNIAALCTASCILPSSSHSSPAAAAGSAIHEFLEMRAQVGEDSAEEAFVAIAKKWLLNDTQTGIAFSQAKKFTWTPPENAKLELALVLLADGTVQATKGGRGHYPNLPEGAVIAGQVDVIWLDGDTVHVRDYKCGNEVYVPPVDYNEQMQVLSLLSARFLGAKTAIPTVVFVRPGDGELDIGEPLGPNALNRIEAKLWVRQQWVESQRKVMIAGGNPETHEGSHCTYCSCAAYCPAKTTMLKRALGGELMPNNVGAPLTRGEAKTLAERLSVLETTARKTREALVAHVDEFGPLEMGPGVVWGSEIGTKNVIDVLKALPLLKSEFGEELVVETLRLKLPTSALVGVIKAAHTAAGVKRQGAATMRRTLAKMHEADMVEKKPTVTYHAYRPEFSKSPEVAAATRTKRSLSEEDAAIRDII